MCVREGRETKCVCVCVCVCVCMCVCVDLVDSQQEGSRKMWLTIGAYSLTTCSH